MNDQELHEALTAVSKSRGKRWIVESVINALLFWQWMRDVIGNKPTSGGAA